jgi:ribonuclease-3
VSDEGDGDRQRAVADLERALGHRFRDRRVFERALRHASFAHERSRSLRKQPEASEEIHEAGDPARDTESNERLEFLGDAVLALVVAEVLYRRHPDWREGELTRASHALVEGRSLAARARALGLGPALALGRTELRSGGDDKDSILENALEALVGAVYLDAGLEAATALVERIFGKALSGEARPVARDPKTALQEQLMSEVGEFPTYRVVHDSAVEGDDRRFEVEVASQGEVLGRGIARTKRAAERLAAREALAQRSGD